jgi:hypothetical protein
MRQNRVRRRKEIAGRIGLVLDGVVREVPQDAEVAVPIRRLWQGKQLAKHQDVEGIGDKISTDCDFKEALVGNAQAVQNLQELSVVFLGKVRHRCPRFLRARNAANVTRASPDCSPARTAIRQMAQELLGIFRLLRPPARQKVMFGQLPSL